MNELMMDLGYRFDRDALCREYLELNGRTPSRESVRWFEAVAPFLVIAYQKGLRHESLLGAFPFLKEEEVRV